MGVEGAGCTFASASLNATGSLVADLVNSLRNLAMAPDVGGVPLFLFVMNAFSRTGDLMILSPITGTSGVTSSPPSCGNLAESDVSGSLKGAAFAFSAFTAEDATGDVDLIGSSKAVVGLEGLKKANTARRALQKIEGRCRRPPQTLQYLSWWSISIPHRSQ
jgi:hypothetical protein